MRMRPTGLRAGCTAIAGALALAAAGCGSSGTPAKTTAGPDASAAVVRAADVTGAASGYRFRATIAMTGAATLNDTMSGTILRTANQGEIDLHQSLEGQSTTMQERFSGRTFWLSASSVPNASRLTDKPWLKYDIASTLDQLGVGGLPSGGSDPGQFLTYLKSVGGGATRLGTATIGGVPTTHYTATVNLHQYVRAVPAAQRTQARRAVTRLISTIGSDQLHIQVWIDARHLTRRMRLSFPECVQNEHLHLSMTVDMYDFGTKADVTLPGPSQSYDITPLVDRELAQQKLGCTATS